MTNKAQLREVFKEKRIHSASQSVDLKNFLKDLLGVLSVAAYLPIHNEIDTMPLIRWGIHNQKKIYVPQYQLTGYQLAQLTDLETDLEKGKFGILQPKVRCPTEVSENIDLWVIPGLAFTPQGDRLGRGGGYYDRLLHNTRGKKIGVAHLCQKIEALPQNTWDVKMDQVFFYPPG